MRVEKKVTAKGDNTTETTQYFYHGKKLMRQVKGNHVLHFYYDAEGRPAMVMYNGTMYTYAHSLQGDIAAIVDSSGNLVVEYKYDAWGNITTSFGSLNSTLGKLNPFRYRGYVYDVETELYWLYSRYYYPARCRFINADAVICNENVAIGLNQFAYCWNNPQKFSDKRGFLPSVDDVKLTYSFVGGLFLSLKGYNLSKACYQHFLNGNGKPLDNKTIYAIGQSVANSKVFQEHITKRAPDKAWLWIDQLSPEEESLEMTGDLYYAVQHIRPTSICLRTRNGIVGISYFSDCYDFEYRTKDDAPDFFNRVVNNEVGYALQENGYGVNYQIEVPFVFYIPIE